jgi:hypothetical protein
MRKPDVLDYMILLEQLAISIVLIPVMPIHRGVYSMSWQFWKSKDERIKIEWDNATNLRNQGKWLDAASHYDQVEKLSADSGDPAEKELGAIAKALSRLFISKQNYTQESLSMCSLAMSKLDPDTKLEIPYEAKAGEVMQEVLLLSKEASLKKPDLNVSMTDATLADEYEKLAQEYLGLGREKLVVGGLYNISDTTFSRAISLMGLSRVIKGRAEESRDPSKAVDHYSEALGYFNQINDKDMQAMIEERTKKLVSMAKCWLCGRPMQGEEINFVYLRSYITPYLSGKFSSEAPAVLKNDAVAVCNGCYGAMSLLSESISDRVSKAYYDRAMVEMDRMREQLEREIASCRSEISSVRFRAR